MTDKLPVYFEREIAIAKMFKRPAPKFDTEAEIMDAFNDLDCSLSSENLWCDGEATKTQVKAKVREIKAAWKYLEKKLGRKHEPENGYLW